MGLFSRKKTHDTGGCSSIAVTSEEIENRKHREKVGARVGLEADMVNSVVMDKQKTPVADTRKHKNAKSVKIQADSIGDIGGEEGVVQKRRKKKKKKLDPKEEYARLKEEEEKRLADEEAKENPTLLDVEEVWYDCVRCMEKAEVSISCFCCVLFSCV